METFKTRQVDVTFKLSFGAFDTRERKVQKENDEGVVTEETETDIFDTLVIKGLRVIARINLSDMKQYGATISIFGLTRKVMNRLLTLRQQHQNQAFHRNIIILSEGTNIIFRGFIFYAHADYNLAPNIPLVIEASPGFPNNITVPAHGGEFPGTYKVREIFTRLAQMAGKQLVYNASKEKILHNQVFNGDVGKMIRDAAYAAEVSVAEEAHRLVVVEKGGSREDLNVLRIAPDCGLIGWPITIDWGCNITAVYSPEYFMFRKVFLEVPDMPIHNGKTYVIFNLTFEIDSEVPSGQWIARMTLSEPNFNGIPTSNALKDEKE